MTLLDDRERLYGLLNGLTGIPRKRDTRLEKIAEDRALEARYTVGLVLDGNDDIPHPVPQLLARTWPLQDATKLVLENAIWIFGYPDPIAAMAEGWWVSPEHHANLVSSATTWGLGLYTERGLGGLSDALRYYGICVFTEDLLGTPPPEPAYDWAGQINPFGTRYPSYVRTSYSAVQFDFRAVASYRKAGKF